MSEEKRQYWLDKPKNVDKIVKSLYGFCILMLLAADFGYHKHSHFEFEDFHGFYAWYGLIGSISLVLLAKLVRRVLLWDEDYYDG